MTQLPPVSAGEVLQFEFLEPMGLAPHTLAAAINVPTAQIEAVLQGQQLIDAVLDRKLCQQWGLSSGYWLRAQQLSP